MLSSMVLAWFALSTDFYLESYRQQYLVPRDGARTLCLKGAFAHVPRFLGLIVLYLSVDFKASARRNTNVKLEFSGVVRRTSTPCSDVKKYL